MSEGAPAAVVGTADRAGLSIESRTPARPGEGVATFEEIVSENVEDAVQRGAAAQERWGALPAPTRGAYPARAAELVEDRADDRKACLRLANDSELGLAAGIVTGDLTTTLATLGQTMYIGPCL